MSTRQHDFGLCCRKRLQSRLHMHAILIVRVLLMPDLSMQGIKKLLLDSTTAIVCLRATCSVFHQIASSIPLHHSHVTNRQ